jgi:amino acid transporter
MVVLTAVIYGVMSGALPRSGGDYVWCSRIFHPAIGFMQSFYMVFAAMYWGALFISWVPGWYLSTLLAWWGTATSNPAIRDWGAMMATPQWTFIIGSLLIPYLLVYLMSGMKNLARIQKVLFVFANFGMVLLFAVMLTTPTSVFTSNLNEYLSSAGSTATYDSILQSAKGVGYVPGWAWLPTIMAFPYAFGMYGGYNYSSFIGGEVKDAGKKMIWTMVPTAIVSVICFTIMGFGIFQMAGFDFYNGIQYLYYLNPGAYPKELILPPLVNYFVTFATKNSVIIFAILFCYVMNGIWQVGSIPTFTTRALFAYSFDRVLPTKWADVSERFHVPMYIITLEVALTWICLYLLCFTPFFQYTANVFLGWMVCYAIVGLTVMVFPWKRKGLFETAIPSGYRRKVAGVPVLSILGAIMFGFFIFETYAGATNQALGGPLSWASVGIGVVGMFVLGLVIYYASYLYQKRKGVDISLAFAEVPPE